MARNKGVRIEVGEEWEAMEKEFDRQAKRAPVLVRMALLKPIQLVQKQMKKNLPAKGRGWKSKYGVESGAMKKFIDQRIVVNKEKGYIWAGAGVKKGSVVTTSKKGKVRTHTPWNVDHLIEFGFWHARTKKFIRPHSFVRKTREQKGNEAINLLGKETKRLVEREFSKKTKK
jgi:hypothetical protein